MIRRLGEVQKQLSPNGTVAYEYLFFVDYAVPLRSPVTWSFYVKWDMDKRIFLLGGEPVLVLCPSTFTKPEIMRRWKEEVIPLLKDVLP